jgi:hypothetical protein
MVRCENWLMFVAQSRATAPKEESGCANAAEPNEEE